MEYDLNRFISAQEKNYEQALKEIKNGKKITHWIWYIFPQLKGLGESYTSQFYGLDGIEEAKSYYENDILKKHLLEISNALLLIDNEIDNILSFPDNLKLKSSMTLFNFVDPSEQVFINIINKFYDGELDQLTLNLLGSTIKLKKNKY